MRQSVRLNSENKQLMDEMLRQVTGNFPVTEYCLPFIGAILYLKKRGINLDGIHCDETLWNILSEYEKNSVYDPLKNVVLEVLNRVANTVKGSKVNQLMILTAIAEFDESEYLHWYDYAIENAAKYRNLVPQTLIPKGLTSLAQAFICNDAVNVFVPFGGIMDFATEIEGYDELDSFEINHTTWLIGKFRLGLGGNAEMCHFECSDIDSWPAKKYDAVISMPPFGMRMNMAQPPMSFKAGRTEESELVAPCRFIESTNDSGICVAFAPTSILLASAVKQKFRAWAIENKILDTIILLPSNMLNGTNIPLACVILRKKPFNENAVRMIDASGIYTNHKNRNLLEVGELMAAFHTDTENVSRTVSYDEIAERDFSWNVKEYVQKEEECPEGYTMSPLEDIVEIPRLVSGTTRDKGLVVKVGDLSDDWCEAKIDLANLNEESNLRNYSRLDQKAILLSSVRTLKPSIIEASEECPVWLNPNVMAIIPKDGIDPEFLCMTLAKMKVPTIGMGTPHISKTYVLRQKVAYPELSVQKNLYREAFNAYILSLAKQPVWLGVIEQMKADYINEVRSRKHDMMPHLRQLSSARKNLEYYLSNREKFTEAAFICGMKEEVENQAKAIDSLSTLLQIFSRESQFGEPEVINIYDFFVHNYFDGENYIVDFIPDNVALTDYGFENTGEEYDSDNIGGFRMFIGHVMYKFKDTNVFMAKDDLKRLCDNIVQNAVTHGFTDSTEPHCLEIRLSVIPERNVFMIYFTNDGNPLPKGMNKTRYGIRGEKAGPTAGTGEGGYVVKSIVEHYGGEYDIFSNVDGETVVGIALPIHRNDE